MACTGLEFFLPPFQPSFVWDVTDEFSTVESRTERGHHFTRARRDRKIRRWRLRWENAEDTTKDYLRAFFEFHLGGAQSFCWTLPDARLFTPGPAFSAITTAQTTGGSLADGTYNIRYTFENTAGETLAAARVQQVIAAGGGVAAIAITAPPRFPADVDNIRIYASLDPAVETQQALTIANPGATANLNSIAAGSALPTVNGMTGVIEVLMSNAPRFQMIAAGVWLINVDFEELLV